MKLTFTSFDIQATVSELQKSIVGLRVNQIYDVDHKTYLIKLQKPEHKAVLVLESATRLHTTDYQLPKSPAPSGFAMKLRKHLRNKRLQSIEQLGMDRVVQMTFGSGAAEHHLIIELYDRGNITLTDADYTILIILRPRIDGEDTRFAARELYPINSFRQPRPVPTLDQITEAVKEAKPNTALKKLLNPILDCGSGWVVHELTLAGMLNCSASAVVGCPDKLALLQRAAAQAQQHMLQPPHTKGYIIQRREERASLDGRPAEVLLLQQEFHPLLYAQHADLPHVEYESFNQACDEFFRSIESQRLEQREMQREKDAYRKLDNVRIDHQNRLKALRTLQDQDTQRGQLIELNQELVEAAITQVRAAVAHQIDWCQIQELLEEAQEREDPTSLAIKKLSLSTNSMTMVLSDPYDFEEDDCLLDSDEEREEGTESAKLRPTTVDIDLDLSAYANARKYYTSRRKAGTKAEKTMAASAAALKSATRKTKQQLKEVHTSSSINKQRKVHWFEKFLWFISSENYLLLAGHDQQQNELLVKRHMKPNDVYVHADLHGASSVILKNPSGRPVPPASLLQGGSMALCNSRAWAEKMVTSAWWVWGHQVSKTAPSGEYLTTGSFMVRGKKNFLPHSHLIYGFGFLFRLEESSIQRHANERRVKSLEEDMAQASDTVTSHALQSLAAADRTRSEEGVEEVELQVSDGEDGEEEEQGTETCGMSDIKEEINDIEDEYNEEKEINEEENKYEKCVINDVDETKEEYDEKENATNESNIYNNKDDIVEFPDTVVEMTHIAGDTFAVSASALKVAPPVSGPQQAKSEESRHKDKTGRRKKGNVSECESEFTVDTTVPSERGDDVLKEVAKNAPLKRGQRSRLKKMNTKYKDQDDEERELRMRLLQSAGAKKEPKRVKKQKGKKKQLTQMEQLNNTNNVAGPAAAPSSPAVDDKRVVGDEQKEQQEEEEEEDGEEEEEEGTQLGDDLAILAELTGQPVAEDELLYTIPMCAPYAALANYKYKVKMMPGPGKKGKACKTAVSLFLSLKPQVVRECDLMRALRDTDLSRNLPGKVKVSAPNISKVKK